MVNIYGTRIKKRLLELGMTQRELAQRMDISEKNLSKILCGDRKGWKHRDRIEEIIGNKHSLEY